MMPVSPSTIHEFRDSLLPTTLQNALELPSYQDHWKSVDIGRISSQRQLEQLPLLFRETYQSRLIHDHREDDRVSVIIHTRGTSSGRLMHRYRSVAESEFVGRFMTRMNQGFIREGDTPLRLNALGTYGHGGGQPVPSTAYTFSGRLDTQPWLDQSIEMLGTAFTVPGFETRISEILAFPDDFILLTVRLDELGIRPSDLPVAQVAIQGHISSGYRRMISESWPQVHLINQYSLSEVFGGATSCNQCSAFHANPFVVPELVDPFSHEVVSKGDGILVLSELYPFTQYQPLIRYWTGDLVSFRDTRCSSADFAFVYLGRFELTPRLTDRILVRLAPLRDALEDIPEVARRALRVRVPEMDQVRIGPPLAEISHSREDSLESLSITVRPTFHHHAEPRRALQLTDQVKRALTRDNPELKALVAGNALALNVTLRDLDWASPNPFPG